MTWWRVPRMWDGQTVAILASGGSMSQAVADAVHAAGVPTIAVNSTWKLAPWADLLYAADETWWRYSGPKPGEFAGLRVSCMQVPGVLWLRNTGARSFDPDPSALRTGRNSGYQALHIAAHAGAARVLLCGFNMGGPHWHGRHASPLRETPPEMYAKWLDYFRSLAPELKERGIDVVNCTPGSALKCFRVADLAAELCPEP